MGITSPFTITRTMKPNVWISSSQVAELLAKQLVTWPLAETNYNALKTVQVKSFDMGGFVIRVQYNPSRIVSSAAKTDSDSIKKRKCFLCPDNLPVEQERLPFGANYLVLTNPYPIFPQHFTIPSREHLPQSILIHFPDFLELVRRMDAFTVFYNGPKCGASAPDHLHFQAGIRSFMPIDDELELQLKRFGSLVLEEKNGVLLQLTHYLRNGFVIKAKTQSAAQSLFGKLYHALNIVPDETEPRMNIFGHYENGIWTITVIPRRQHRPWQYEAEGGQHLLSSPGAADMGGLFITPLKEDFEKMNADLLRDVYEQVCFNESEIGIIASGITKNK